MGWTEYQQVRYATARSVFKWDGTDTVKVGSDETPGRVLDEEVSTDQARWHNRYWIDSEGQIRQSEQYLGADYFPVKTTLIKEARWHNRYWIDSEGQIRQSEQYLGADYFPVKTTLIKAAKQ